MNIFKQLETHGLDANKAFFSAIDKEVKNQTQQIIYNNLRNIGNEVALEIESESKEPVSFFMSTPEVKEKHVELFHNNQNIEGIQSGNYKGKFLPALNVLFGKDKTNILEKYNIVFDTLFSKALPGQNIVILGSQMLSALKETKDFVPDGLLDMRLLNIEFVGKYKDFIVFNNKNLAWLDTTAVFLETNPIELMTPQYCKFDELYHFVPNILTVNCNFTDFGTLV